MEELHPVQPLDNLLLSQRIKIALLEHLRAAANGDTPLKLPKEEDLARQLGVSRNGLRDVLTVLEEEGYITRRRSKGTIANSQILRSRCRLDLATELSKLITSEGYTPRFETKRLERIEAPHPGFAGRETAYIEVEKVFYADDDPVACAIDRIAGGLVDRAGADHTLLYTIPHYQFLSQHCGENIATVLDDIYPEVPGEKIAGYLQLPPGAPIMCLEGPGFNYDHEIVQFCTLYLKTGKLNYKILRKRF